MSRIDPRSAMGRWLRTIRGRLPAFVSFERGSRGAHRPLRSPIGVGHALHRFESVIASADHRVRQRALDALAELDPVRGERVLSAFLDDPSLEVRQRALTLCSERPTLGLVPALIRVLDDPAPELRVSATRALQRVLRSRDAAGLDPETSPRAELFEWWKAERLRERLATSARIIE